MVYVERTLTVRKPIDVVTGYLRDFAHTESWDPGTVSCTRTGEGPVEVGSEWHNVSEFRGKKTELTYRLTRAEPDRLTFIGKNKTATSTDDLTFATVADGTEITYHATIVFNGIARLADPFLKGAFEKLGDELVPKMTEAIEAL